MRRVLSVAVMWALANVLQASASETIGWQDLIDQEAQVYEDPFLALAYEQLDDLRTVAVETARLERTDLSDTERAARIEKRNAAQSRLADAGIDADWLISQRWVVAERREKAATAVNPIVDGATVTLGGFAIPAPPDADGADVVYLVPERGMCSHVPPPNPNQMIRARLTDDWTPSMLHEPVRLTGTLSAMETQHVFRIVDGDVPMRASFVMEVAEVETMADFLTEVEPTEEGATGLAARLRSAHRLQTQSNDASE